MLKKILMSLVLTFFILAQFASVMACGGGSSSSSSSGSSGGSSSSLSSDGGWGCNYDECNDDGLGLLDNMMCQGTRFEEHASDSGLGSALSGFVYNDVFNAVFSIGNLIFAAVTVILGVKFIWSGAEGKSQVQESLPSFVLAVIFFYLAGPLLSFILDVTMDIQTASDWETLSGSFIWVINTIVKYLALAGIIFVGVRYLLASAEGKASLKTSMSGIVIGLLFVFLSTNVIGFVINMGQDIL